MNAGTSNREGYREFASWMEEVENIWNQKRKGKAGKHTAVEWLDYSSKLTHQTLTAQYLVLYNAAGTNISAAVVDRKSLPRPFVVEHKLYWAAIDYQAEARFLAAILNADIVNEEIKPFQSQGLLGERDIEKKVLELPIPMFDSSRKDHMELAHLGEIAEVQVRSFVASNELPKTLGGRRAIVRKHIAGTLSDINKLVHQLLRESGS